MARDTYFTVSIAVDISIDNTGLSIYQILGYVLIRSEISARCNPYIINVIVADLKHITKAPVLSDYFHAVGRVGLSSHGITL